MAEVGQIHVLAAIAAPSQERYRTFLSRDTQIALRLVTTGKSIFEALDGGQELPDILVVDYALGDVYSLINSLRERYPRLLILLVDEDADFGMPGRADEVSVDPFENSDLLKRIKRMTEDRRLETLRTDVLPQIRTFAKSLRRAASSYARQQAAITAVREMGYDYAAVYQAMPSDPGSLKLAVQDGPRELQDGASREESGPQSLVAWVGRSGQSRIVGPGDEPSHPFLREKRFGAGVCVPIGSTFRFGVIFACRNQPGSITKQGILMLELVSAQLASALSKQS
jgi:hypothetical protein